MFNAIKAVPAAAIITGATRHPGLVAGVSVVSALTLVVGAVLVGGSLTQPPAAEASVVEVANTPVETEYVPPVSEDLSGFQLPTLSLD